MCLPASEFSLLISFTNLKIDLHNRRDSTVEILLLITSFIKCVYLIQEVRGRADKSLKAYQVEKVYSSGHD